MKKRISGIVVSTKMNNTVVVEVFRYKPHAIYKKLMKRSKKFLVDSANQNVQVGDTVIIEETIPLSKNKHFRLVGGSK